MEAAAAAGGPEPEPEPERPGGPAGPADLSAGAPGEPPGPEVPVEPRAEVPPGPERCEPQQVGLGEREPPGPEESEPCEPGKMEPPRPSEPSAPEEAAGPLGPATAAPAAGSAGEEAASGRDGPAATGEAPPAARAEEDPGPAAPGAERRSGEAAGEPRAAAEEGEEKRRERAALLEEHGRLAGERERLRQASARLQLRLGELLRAGRGAERRRAAGPGGPQLYGQRLLLLRERWERREQEAAARQQRVAARRRDGEERQARARAEWAAFQARKKAVAVASLGRRLGGRAAAAAAVERLQAREWQQEQRVREARVENIKLKHEIQKLETILKAQADPGKGQPSVEFEHLKKENQKHSAKNDDLSDEILKLKRKVSNTVHILSQFREKLQFMEAENQCRKAELMDIETVLSQKRDILSQTKQARDKLWRNNLELQQKRGLLGNETLLRDFEEKVDTIELLSQRLETLKHHHAELILTCRGIQKKIKEANSSFLAEMTEEKKAWKINKQRSFP